jgi:hypothetical protein
MIEEMTRNIEQSWSTLHGRPTKEFQVLKPCHSSPLPLTSMRLTKGEMSQQEDAGTDLRKMTDQELAERIQKFKAKVDAQLQEVVYQLYGKNRSAK